MKGIQDQIRHIGTVSQVDGNVLHVKMLQSSACAGCHASKLCQSSETKEKEVDVMTGDAASYEVGQKVLLIGSVHQGLKATVWAYMLPIVLLVAALLVCTKAGLGETVSALASLGVLVPYFFLLWLARDKFRETFSFEVHKL